MSDIQDYTKYIIKKHKTLPANPPIHIYMNRINNRFVFKMKDDCKLELETLETMKLSDRKRIMMMIIITIIIDKTKNG